MAELVPEVIDINKISDISVIDIDGLKGTQGSGLASVPIDKPAVNFGGGIELLMNEKQKKKENDPYSENLNLGVDDLDKLENELNDLSASDINTFPNL